MAFISVEVETETGMQNYAAQVDGAGAFRIDSISAGHARLTAMVSPVTGRTLTHHAEFSVDEGQEIDASADLTPAATVTGTLHGMTPGRFASVVLVPGQVEVEKATLTGIFESTKEAVAQALLKNENTFELPALAPGQYTLIAWMATPPRRIDGMAVRSVTVREGKTAAPLVVTLERP